MNHPDPHVPAVSVAVKSLSCAMSVPKTGNDEPNMAKSDSKCVTCCKRPRSTTLEILKDVNIALAPGSTTLVLAPPGSGTTTLMKSIAGMIPNKQIKSGQVLYNGQSSDSCNFSIYQAVRYVPECGLHMAQPNGGDTWDSARKSGVQGPPKRNLSPNLDECADTDVVSRPPSLGVSGRQRKQATIDIDTLMSQSRAILLDECSTVLDSATALGISVTLCRWARRTNGILLAASLQPTPELYELFDNVLLLKEGKVVYHGPRPALPAYLTQTYNITIPSARDDVDFVFEFLIDQESISKSYGNAGDAQSFTTEVLAAKFKRSKYALDVRKYIDGDYKALDNWTSAVAVARHKGRVRVMSLEQKVKDFKAEAPALGESGTRPTKEDAEEGFSKSKKAGRKQVVKAKESKTKSQGAHNDDTIIPDSSAVVTPPETEKKDGGYMTSLQSAWTSTLHPNEYPSFFENKLWLAITRQAKLVFRDTSFVWGHIGQAIIMGWIIGSVLCHLALSELVLRYSAMLFAAIYLGFASHAEVPITLVDQVISARQLRAGLSSSLTYILAVVLVNIPLVVMESFIFGSISYLTTGLSGGVEQYLSFITFLTSVNCIVNFFRTISCAARSLGNVLDNCHDNVEVRMESLKSRIADLEEQLKDTDRSPLQIQKIQNQIAEHRQQLSWCRAQFEREKRKEQEDERSLSLEKEARRKIDSKKRQLNEWHNAGKGLIRLLHSVAAARGYQAQSDMICLEFKPKIRRLDLYKGKTAIFSNVEYIPSRWVHDEWSDFLTAESHKNVQEWANEHEVADECLSQPWLEVEALATSNMLVKVLLWEMFSGLHPALEKLNDQVETWNRANDEAVQRALRELNNIWQQSDASDENKTEEEKQTSFNVSYLLNREYKLLKECFQSLPGRSATVDSVDETDTQRVNEDNILLTLGSIGNALYLQSFMRGVLSLHAAGVVDTLARSMVGAWEYFFNEFGISVEKDEANGRVYVNSIKQGEGLINMVHLSEDDKSILDETVKVINRVRFTIPSTAIREMVRWFLPGDILTKATLPKKGGMPMAWETFQERLKFFRSKPYRGTAELEADRERIAKEVFHWGATQDSVPSTESFERLALIFKIVNKVPAIIKSQAETEEQWPPL